MYRIAGYFRGTKFTDCSNLNISRILFSRTDVHLTTTLYSNVYRPGADNIPPDTLS